MTIKQIAETLRSQGHVVKTNRDSSGHTNITDIDGLHFRASTRKGNIFARQMLSVGKGIKSAALTTKQKAYSAKTHIRYQRLRPKGMEESYKELSKLYQSARRMKNAQGLWVDKKAQWASYTKQYKEDAKMIRQYMLQGYTYKEAVEALPFGNRIERHRKWIEAIHARALGLTAQKDVDSIITWVGNHDDPAGLLKKLQDLTPEQRSKFGVNSKYGTISDVLDAIDSYYIADGSNASTIYNLIADMLNEITTMKEN